MGYVSEAPDDVNPFSVTTADGSYTYNFRYYYAKRLWISDCGEIEARDEYEAKDMACSPPSYMESNVFNADEHLNNYNSGFEEDIPF